MDPLGDFEQDLQWVFDGCRSQMKAYPFLLRERALDYLERYDAFEKDFHRNYICYILPFWLGQTFAVSRNTCRKIALANLSGFLYFLIQDAVMDAVPGDYQADLLPVGNLLFFDFYNLYREILPDNTLFWKLAGRYLQEWADSVLWEREEFWTKQRMMDEADLQIIARKAAPLKITNAAFAILSEKLNTMELMNAMVESVLITSQLLDDCTDWQEDLRSGNCTLFLSRVMKYHNLTDFFELTDPLIKEAVYFGNILPELMAVAVKNQAMLKPVTGFSIPYLIVFHENLLRDFEAMTGRIQKHKKAVLAGGFNRWLAENQSSFNFIK